MNFFRIFAHGTEFDVDAFLRSSEISFTHVWHRGDKRGSYVFPSNGVEINLGDGRTLSMCDQDRLACQFLEDNELALTKLAQFPGTTTFILGLHYRIQISPNTLGFCMSPSAQLMRIAIRIGIEPTFYVDLDWKDQPDQET